VRVGRAVEYLALAAKCTFAAWAEKYTRAAGPVGIRRLLGVVVQLASLAIGGAKGAEIDAHGFFGLIFLPIRNREAARGASEE